jgi:hypothetical protein
MKKVEFISELSAKTGLSLSDTQIFLQSLEDLLTESLMVGEPVTLGIGRFFPLMFSADKSFEWVDGTGPLAHASRRNSDRVIPMFEWDGKVSRMVSDYAPIEGAIADKIRLASKNRTKRILRSKAYKASIYNSVKRGAATQ